MLEINNICKSYGKKLVLNNISLRLNNGIHGLLGPNGAGKTTLIRILATVLEPNSGSIIFNNINWRDKDKVRELIGYLPQHFSMYKNLTVYEALSHVAALKNITKDLKNSLHYVIEQVNLTEQTNSKISTLSGGMIRRLGIAQAILGNPQILIIDEPTAGLDPEERIRFRNLIEQIGDNCIVLISTHIVEDVEAMCDEITIINKGTILTNGSIDRISKIADGKVWSLEVLSSNYNSVNYPFTVISQKKQGDKYLLRILSEHNPRNNAILETPTIEDSYIYMVGKQNEK